MMKIKKIIIENIGPYKNKEFIFEHSCSLIVDKNEAGKSILANSILEALYPSKQPIVQPGNGKITLEIEADQDIYQIIRDYRDCHILKNGKVLKYETKKKGRIIKKSPGEIIFNLPREIFINSAFLMQKAGINMNDLYSITSYLEEAIDTGFQDSSASLALTKIKESLYESIHSGVLFPFNTKGKLDTAIKIWTNKLAECENKKLYLNSLVENQKEILENYVASLSEYENINYRLAELDSAYALWKIQKDDTCRLEIERLEKRNEELKNFENLVSFYKEFEDLKLEEQQFIYDYDTTIQGLQKDLDNKKQKSKIITSSFKKYFWSNISFALFSILAGIFIKKIFLAGIVLCIVLFIYQLKLSRENKELNQEIKELQLKKDNLDTQIHYLISRFRSVYNQNEFFNVLKQISLHKNEIKELIKNSEQIEVLKKQILSENERNFYESKISLMNKKLNNEDIEAYEQKKERLLRQKDEIKDRIHKLQAEYDKIMQHKKEVDKIVDQIQAIEKYLQTLDKFKKALQKALEVLENITWKQHEFWAEKLNKKASQLLIKITGKAIGLSFNKDLSFNVKLPEIEYQLSEKEIEQKLSGGMVEQIYLTIRLILANILSKEKKIPFILDEPFAHSDDERFIKGMNYLIQEISNSNQVIILSCHQHRLKLIEELKNSFCLISIKN